MKKTNKFKENRKGYSVNLPLSLINRIRFLKSIKKGKFDIGNEVEKKLLPLIESLELNLKITKNTWKESRKCPKCNNYMVIRNGDKGKFYGCLNFPECRQTSSI
jgi:hypothetical protein